MFPAWPCLVGMVSQHKHKHVIWREPAEVISPKRYSPWYLTSCFEVAGLVTEARSLMLSSFSLFVFSSSSPLPLSPRIPLPLPHLFTSLCLSAYMYTHVPPMTHAWWEDNLCESVLLFHEWILRIKLRSSGVVGVSTCSAIPPSHVFPFFVLSLLFLLLLLLSLLFLFLCMGKSNTKGGVKEWEILMFSFFFFKCTELHKAVLSI